MQIETNGKELASLLDQYNQQIDVLKSKLLNGISWEELAPIRKKITELAIAIHRIHNCKVPDVTEFSNSSQGVLSE
jgi:hypothetical protein